jgi:hypothetical protein
VVRRHCEVLNSGVRLLTNLASNVGLALAVWVSEVYSTVLVLQTAGV